MLVGVFDSGLGGISTLNECRRLSPALDYIYYADDAHAPYGNLPCADIERRVLGSVGIMLGLGVSCLVVACNTATSAAAEALRKNLAIPIVGIEPAIAPAARAFDGKKILLICTEATARQPKLNTLLSRFPECKIEILPLAGLAGIIEAGGGAPDCADDYLTEHLARHTDATAVVLGCTHYCFVRESVARITGAAVFDGNEGVARRLRSITGEAGAGETGLIGVALSSGSEAKRALYRSLIIEPAK